MMDKTSLRLPGELLRRAKGAMRRLLDRQLPHRRHERLIELARQSRGMWADRDPDQVLAESRAGLRRRNEDLALPTFRGKGLQAGVDLDKSAALLDLMEERG
jgi:hypothetical protein